MDAFFLTLEIFQAKSSNLWDSFFAILILNERAPASINPHYTRHDFLPLFGASFNKSLFNDKVDTTVI